MKILVLFATVIFCSQTIFAAPAPAPTHRLPDIPPDATGEDYEAYLRATHPALAHFGAPVVWHLNDGLDDIIAAGTRNLQWIKKINDARPDGQKLSFTDAAHRTGSPITAPRRYSPSIITTSYQKYINAAAKSFMDVVTGNGNVPATVPTDLKVDAYLDLGRNLDRIYQSATRWRLMAPNLEELAGRAGDDVRGYYFLSQMPNVREKLSQLATLPADEKTQDSVWLEQMCANTIGSLEDCTAELKTATTQAKGALKFYDKYIDNAKEHYDSYFQIPESTARTDIAWVKSAPNVATIPFTDPAAAALRTFMLNVEDEWHWGDWHLRLNFTSTANDQTPHLEFQTGVTPHVNAVGGNIITMDQNTPLTEWENNWTIRHEFGHVLGFLDCYIEFYDEDAKEMISYQLDVTNLMCSRKGNLKQTHYDEMKRVYLK